MMRLLHYYPRALVGDGGPTHAMWGWASAAHSAGCNVGVLYDPALEAESHLRNPAIPLIPVTHVGTGRARIPRGLSSVVRKDDILMLHSTYLVANLGAAWSAQRAGIPYVVVPHGGYNRYARDRRRARKRVWLPVERAYLERALAVHIFFETEIHDTAHVAPTARWLVAPTGFDSPAERWDGGSGGYIAWLGRYDVRTKGLDLLLESMAQLPADTRPPLRLHGKRSEDSRQQIADMARAAGLADVVSVGDAIVGDEKAAFLRRAAAYVHPSRWESLGAALIEAMSHGVPSVVSSSCSIAPTLRQADAALIVDPTPAAIADGILAILQRQEYYSHRGLQFVQTRLSWTAVIGTYLAQLERLERNHRNQVGPVKLRRIRESSSSSFLR